MGHGSVAAIYVKPALACHGPEARRGFRKCYGGIEHERRVIVDFAVRFSVTLSGNGVPMSRPCSEPSGNAQVSVWPDLSVVNFFWVPSGRITVISASG